MNILSLFDGISCSRVALGNVKSYYASEIDKYAIAIAKKNYPDTIHIGDVRSITKDSIIKPDLLIGGSPCQDLSIAKKGRKGLDGERSGLFWEYVRIRNELQPKWFILENVASMSRESKDIISEALGVQPIMIDAALVSAQNRKRLFWTNIPVVGLPTDRGILLKDILEILVENDDPPGRLKQYEKSSSQGHRVYSVNGKSVCLSANGGGLGANTGLYKIGESIRKPTPIECERLQGLPDNYTEGISATQRYKCLGNAFNVDVIRFILSPLMPRE